MTSHTGQVSTVLVDGRVIDHPTAGSRGIGRYTVSLVGALRAASVDVTVLVDDPRQGEAWSNAVPGVVVERLAPRVFREASPDTWFLCTQLMLHPIPLDVIPSAVTRSGLRVMAVMYDVIPQRWPERYLVDGAALQMSRLRTMLARTVDHFVAISTFTADTASVELGVPRGRFTVIGSAVDAKFAPGEKRGSGDGTVVANTGPDDRKNTEALIRAWSSIPARSRAGHHLDIVCGVPDDVRRRWNSLVASLGLDDVRVRGAVSDHELVTTYRSCSLAVFPSLEEGFGLPVAEAAACGAPVVCSDTSSMPEVVTSRDAVFDPYDVGDMARVIERALVDSGYRARLFEVSRACARRWTWERVGEDAARAFTDSGPTSPDRRPIMRPKVAVVGRPDPLIPDAWPHDSEVVVVYDVSNTDLRAGANVVWGWGRFSHGHDFDAVVTRLGDDRQSGTDAMMGAEPGHLWLADGVSVPAYAGRAVSVIVESASAATEVTRVVGDHVPVHVLGAADSRGRVAEVARLVLEGVGS